MRFALPKVVAKVTEILRQVYDLERTLGLFSTLDGGMAMQVGFRDQFRPETDVQAGRFEGKVTGRGGRFSARRRYLCR